MITRRPLLFGLTSAVATVIGGCKRNRTPVVAEVWDEEPAVARAEAIGALAPPWPAPIRGTLDNGLITFWLHEPGSVGMRVRLLVPTAAHASAPRGERVAVAAEHARFEWQRRVQKLGVTIAVEHGPHRIELVASGTDSHLATTLTALRNVLSVQNPSGLEGARERIADQTPAPTTLEIAATATIARLAGADESVDLERLARASRSELQDTWHALIDPRESVLLVHSGTPADAEKAGLRKLAEAWRGTDKRASSSRFVDQATRRLRARVPAKSTGTRLLASPVSPMIVAPGGKGTPALVLGRTIPLTDATDRALARLAQRIAQEEIDASIAINGDTAVWLVGAGIGRAEADRDVQRTVEMLGMLARTRQPRQRLFQAVQLWLGARVVEASLDGEDWTRLFAQSIDLADGDTAIAGALANDAKRQLAITPDELETWTRRWLEPRLGEPGWAWAVAGVDASATKRIERLTPLASTSKA